MTSNLYCPLSEGLEEIIEVFVFDIIFPAHNFVLTPNFSFLSSYSHLIPSVCYYDIGCMLLIEPSFNNDSAKTFDEYIFSAK